MGFHGTPNGNNPQYLEDSLQGFFSTAHVDCCGPPTISKKAAVSDLQIFIYPHLLVPSSTPIWSQWGWIKTYQNISNTHLFICVSVFLQGTSIKTIKNQLFWREKKGDSMAGFHGRNWPGCHPQKNTDTSLKTLMGRLIGDVYYPFIGYSTIWLFNIAMENGPFIDGLPIKNGDFPWLC